MALPGVSTFFLVRHGETDWNAAGRLQGQFDIPLNDRGRAQAHAAATYLVHHYALGTGGRDRATGDDASAMASALECGDVIVSSTLGRAMETAQLIGGAAGLPVFTTSELMETCLGEWQGRTWDEVEIHHPEDAHRWRSDATFAMPGGESYKMRFHRVCMALHKLALTYPNRRVVVVAHGGTLDDIARLVTKVQFGQATKTRKVNAGISIVQYSPRELGADEWPPVAQVAHTHSSTTTASTHTDASTHPDSSICASWLRAPTYPFACHAHISEHVASTFPFHTINPTQASRALGAWRLVEWGISAHLHVIDGAEAHSKPLLASRFDASQAQSGVASQAQSGVAIGDIGGASDGPSRIRAEGDLEPTAADVVGHTDVSAPQADTGASSGAALADGSSSAADSGSIAVALIAATSAVDVEEEEEVAPVASHDAEADLVSS